MRIASLLSEQSQAWSDKLAGLAKEFTDHEFLSGDQALAALPSIDAIIGARIDAQLIQNAPRLKAFFLPITGVNHLPLELLRERGVRLFNVHGNAESVAQCALAMTLAFYGRLIEYHNDLARKKWHGFWAGRGSRDDWSSIWGRPCAVFGTGAIGVAIAKLLKAFDCEVTGYRRRANGPMPPHFDKVEPELAAAVAGAELLFVALPLTPQTRGLFSKELLLGARGKFLVNMGRGAVVDEEGLYLALRDGILKGAGIDTWYNYPQDGAKPDALTAPSRFPIHELPNVVLSPHIGGSTHEAVAKAAELSIDNLRSWLAGAPCAHEVDLSSMY